MCLRDFVEVRIFRKNITAPRSQKKKRKIHKEIRVCCCSMLKFIVYSINKTYTQPKSEEIIIHECTHTMERYYSPGFLHTMTGIKQRSGHSQPCSCLLANALCPSYLHSLGTPPLLGSNIAQLFLVDSLRNHFLSGNQSCHTGQDSSGFHILFCPLLWSLWSHLQS